MKTALCILLLLLSASLAHSKPNKAAPKLDLTTFTSEQLKACLDGSDVCGTHDIYAITAELVSRLPQMKTEQLVSCFANWRICGTGEDQASGWPISDEIARRGNPHALLVRYWSEPNRGNTRRHRSDVAYHFKSHEVVDFMREVLAEGKDEEARASTGRPITWPSSAIRQD